MRRSDAVSPVTSAAISPPLSGRPRLRPHGKCLKFLLQYDKSKGHPSSPCPVPQIWCKIERKGGRKEGRRQGGRKEGGREEGRMDV